MQVLTSSDVNGTGRLVIPKVGAAPAAGSPPCMASAACSPAWLARGCRIGPCQLFNTAVSMLGAAEPGRGALPAPGGAGGHSAAAGGLAGGCFGRQRGFGSASVRYEQAAMAALDMHRRMNVGASKNSANASGCAGHPADRPRCHAASPPPPLLPRAGPPRAACTCWRAANRCWRSMACRQGWAGAGAG